MTRNTTRRAKSIHSVVRDLKSYDANDGHATYKIKDLLPQQKEMNNKILHEVTDDAHALGGVNAALVHSRSTSETPQIFKTRSLLYPASSFYFIGNKFLLS